MKILNSTKLQVTRSIGVSVFICYFVFWIIFPTKLKNNIHVDQKGEDDYSVPQANKNSNNFIHGAVVSNADMKLFEVDSAETADFELLGEQLRVFKYYYDLGPKGPISRIDRVSKERLDFLENIDKRLFPWVRKRYDSILEMKKSFVGSGIVICVGNQHVSQALATMRMIREVHASQVPFEIFYSGDKDLSLKNRNLLEEISYTIVKDIGDYFDNDILKLGSWDLKPFALLASSFQNALLMDADVVFMQNPSTLFKSPVFWENHAIFFRDRSLYTAPQETLDWIRNLFPKPTPKIPSTYRIFNEKTRHEQESGVVLINKKEVLAGLLAVCTLNSAAFRSITYKRVYGDKETFWIGFTTIQEKFHFFPKIPGTIGVAEKDEDNNYKICSRQILHVDIEGNPLWFNGGIAEFKRDSKSPIATMNEWMLEPGNWDLKAQNLACLTTDRKPTKVSKKLRKILDSSAEVFLEERDNYLKKEPQVWFGEPYLRVETTNSTNKVELQKTNENPLIHTYNKNYRHLFEDVRNDVDVITLGSQLRIFKIFYDHLVSNPNVKNEKMKQIFYQIESSLFPWIKTSFPTTLDLTKGVKGSGIVICAGNDQVKISIANIMMLRQVHETNLPIEIFYAGDSDLSIQNQKKFQSIPGVTTKDITKLLDAKIVQFQGWSIKPFAMLVSSFEHVMLIDSDVVFLQPPEVLFESEFFKVHKAVFFRDRSLFDSTKETIQWFLDIMPKPPSKYSQTFRIFHGKTGHEQESGVVLVNKKEVLPGLLATCTLNVGSIKQITYEKVFGDKETFWLGFETIREQYQFYSQIPGTIGISSKNEKGGVELCSRQILHLDQTGSPLWVNGGISVSKYDENSPAAIMKEWMAEPGEWYYKGDNYACISKVDTVHKVTPQLDKIIQSLQKVFLKYRNKE